MSNLALHGDPYAKTALGVAFVSEAVPLAGGSVISSPVAISALLKAGLYSPNIFDAIHGFIVPSPPPASLGGYAGYAAREFLDMIYTQVINRKNYETPNNSCH